jgi:hypothetical protein
VYYIDLFLVCAHVCAAGAIVLLGLKAARVVKVPWWLTLLVCVAMAVAGWCCLEMAASINRSV